MQATRTSSLSRTRNFGDKIREHIEKNNRTQKEGQMRALMEQMQRLTK